MLVASAFDLGLIVKFRRKALRLRQLELARAAGVGREWIIDLERGRDGLDLSRVMRVLEALGAETSVGFGRGAPAWTVPLTQEAEVRQRRLDALRPRRRATLPNGERLQ